MKNSSLTISSDVKATFVPFLLVIALLIAIGYAGNLGYGKIQEQLIRVNEIRETTSALQTKYDVLAVTNVESLDPANASLIAVPSTNQSVLYLAQVKQIATEYNVQITNITVRGQGVYKNDIQRGNMKLELTAANSFQIIDFVNELKQIAPLSSVNTVSIDSKNGSTDAELEIFVYWAVFPETIPALTEPLTVLTQTDQELLDTLTSLRIPSFTVLNPSTTQLRVDPFR